jgi:2,6-dihydroxypseudooxynicotine hydrolase
MHRSNSSNEEEARQVAVRMSLEGVAEKISCPLYVVAGKLDRVIPHQQAIKLAHTASGEVVLNLVEDGGHAANNRAYKYRTQSADWIATKLGV